ncbi:unnamed protein product [Acanthoscelides obtectus]|uniref:Uncharacterized protein n=1 Tax=Acanthoscelides obtectus TaxID=200917 RepID=A0A9P0KH70_ACAOB|nr:unnamed protein product [Acanthoscelides obtectus]CAK1654270.1 hypothetical protein AOBTE_LOCUS18500 [Acanthoscelides obtectus]
MAGAKTVSPNNTRYRGRQEDDIQNIVYIRSRIFYTEGAAQAETQTPGHRGCYKDPKETFVIRFLNCLRESTTIA